MEQLNTHPIFVALTRPPMVMGVTLDYVSVSFLVAMCAFIAMDNVLYLLLYVPLHVIGYGVCLFDPQGFRIIGKLFFFLPNKNKTIWGASAYAPF